MKACRNEISAITLQDISQNPGDEPEARESTLKELQ